MKRSILIISLLLMVVFCYGQTDYVLYRSSSNTNAYYNHTLTGCSPTTVYLPIYLTWSAADGTSLTSNNYVLTGSYSTTDYCTSRTTVYIGCNLGQLDGGVRYTFPFDNNGPSEITTPKTGINLSTSYANGTFSVGITPRRPSSIIKYDFNSNSKVPLILMQDEMVYLFTESKDLPFPLNSNYTYQIDWRANSSDTWKTITSYPFKVPYSVLKDTSDEGKYIYLRSRIIRSTEGVVDGTNPLEVKQNNESLIPIMEILPSTDDDPSSAKSVTSS